MRKSKTTRCFACLLTFGVLLSSASCTIDQDTTSSLVDLAASTTGSFIEILLTTALNGLINLGSFTIDTGAPIATQMH